MRDDRAIDVFAARTHADATAHERDLIARWRAANPEATCSDATAKILAEMEFEWRVKCGNPAVRRAVDLVDVLRGRA